MTEFSDEQHQKPQSWPCQNIAGMIGTYLPSPTAKQCHYIQYHRLQQYHYGGHHNANIGSAMNILWLWQRIVQWPELFNANQLHSIRGRHKLYHIPLLQPFSLFAWGAALFIRKFPLFNAEAIVRDCMIQRLHCSKFSSLVKKNWATSAEQNKPNRRENGRGFAENQWIFSSERCRTIII